MFVFYQKVHLFFSLPSKGHDTEDHCCVPLCALWGKGSCVMIMPALQRSSVAVMLLLLS